MSAHYELTRREFLQYAARLGLSATAIALLDGCGMLPTPTPAKIPRIGFLFTGSRPSPILDAFEQGLRTLGYVEGKNIIIDWRYAEGRDDQLSVLAEELVRLNPDVIVANAGGVYVVKRATNTIPIVAAITGDLVGTGLAASLARPGGNVTGLTSLAPQLAGKRLELAKETFSKLASVGVLWNPVETAMVSEIGETRLAAEAMRLEIQSLEVRDPKDFEAAFEAALGARVEVLIVVLTTFFQRNRSRLVELAAKSRLPTVSGDPDFARAGGLMAYGPNTPDMSYRAAAYVDKILKGTKPGDLPIEQPTKLEFVINLKTAKALGLTLPQSILARATDVIQ